MADDHAASEGDPLLRISGLSITFGEREAVHEASWEVRAGEIVGLVGESGSGKSATGLAILGLHDPGTGVTGSIRLAGSELVGADERMLRAVRGRRVAMISQDALDALNPYRPIGAQIAEAYLLHHRASRAEARERAVEMLTKVGIAEPARRAREYPHQFSGGMRQRAMIALALINEPELIIADEPTTALDATVQAQVLNQLLQLQRETGVAVVLITHDFGVVKQMCRRVVVMYRGRVVEQGPAERVLTAATHPYTRALVASVPSVDDPPGSTLPTVPDVVSQLVGDFDEVALANPELRVPEGAATTVTRPGAPPPGTGETAAAPHGRQPLLSVRDLSVSYSTGPGRSHRAVREVSFDIAHGETFGLVGESGSGKSTISRVLLGLKAPESGRVLLDGEDITRLSRRRRRRLAPRAQMVFQDPYGSLNPDRRVGDTVGAGLVHHTELSREERRARVAGLLTEVGLDPELAGAYPDSLSGGMRQRVGVARALALEPQLLIADEPVSALDVSVQAQVLNLLSDLHRRRGLAMLFISHDLTVVRHMSDRIAVLRAGEIVEAGDRDQIMAHPESDYTRALLDAGYSLHRTPA